MQQKVKGCSKCGGLIKPGYDCELCEAGFCGDCVYIKKVILTKTIPFNLWVHKQLRYMNTIIVDFIKSVMLTCKLFPQVGNRHKVVCKPCDDG